MISGWNGVPYFQQPHGHPWRLGWGLRYPHDLGNCSFTRGNLHTTSYITYYPINIYIPLILLNIIPLTFTFTLLLTSHEFPINIPLISINKNDDGSPQYNGDQQNRWDLWMVIPPVPKGFDRPIPIWAILKTFSHSLCRIIFGTPKGGF